MEKLKILVIDDSEFLRNAMKKFFDNYDIDVSICGSGLEGIKSASQIRPDIIFLDLMMPNFSGLDVLKILKALDTTRNIPIVLITAHNKEDMIEEARKLGISKLILKPLKRSDVFRVMDELLGGQTLSNQKLAKLFQKDKETDVQDDDEHNAEIKSKLLKVFLKSADLQIRDIRSAIDVKNQFMLKTVVHDLRGQGSSIGYNRLTMLSEYIETMIDKQGENLNWEEVSTFTGKIINQIDIIKSENQEEDIKP